VRRRSITIVTARAAAFLGIGSAGMVKQLFFQPTPDLKIMWICVGLMLGPAVWEAIWRARNPAPQPPGAEPERSSPQSASQQ
jgi:hypothetical protein